MVSSQLSLTENLESPDLPRIPADPLVRSRYRGCLLGGAVGDALGAPVEFMKLDAIRKRFGPKGIQDFIPAYGKLGAITDDTQMTMFTAEGMLRAFVRARMRGIGPVFPSVTARAYLRWLLTQGFQCDAEPVDKPSGWLIEHRELFDRRVPGNTCLAALREMKRPGDPASNDSKGCGGVMWPRRRWPSACIAHYAPKISNRVLCSLLIITGIAIPPVRSPATYWVRRTAWNPFHRVGSIRSRCVM